jgi:protein gp37
MSDKSTIEWTEATWNPVTGCDRVSEGCDHCYSSDELAEPPDAPVSCFAAFGARSLDGGWGPTVKGERMAFLHSER